MSCELSISSRFGKMTLRYWECTLTHWGRVTHICVDKLTIIGSDNGLSPGRRQAIIWTNAGILLIGPLGTNFSENLIGIQTFSFKKMRLKVSSAKWRPFCLGLDVLMGIPILPRCDLQVSAAPQKGPLILNTCLLEMAIDTLLVVKVYDNGGNQWIWSPFYYIALT